MVVRLRRKLLDLRIGHMPGRCVGMQKGEVGAGGTRCLRGHQRRRVGVVPKVIGLKGGWNLSPGGVGVKPQRLTGKAGDVPQRRKGAPLLCH